MPIVEVTERNIADAGFVHSESWKESHRSFCSAEFVGKHSPSAQTDYLRREMNSGGHIFMLIDRYPVGIVSVHGDLIENLYVLPSEQGRLSIPKAVCANCQSAASSITTTVLSCGTRALSAA